MRLFIAIPLAESVAAELTRLMVRLRSTNTNLRWASPESWHVTLQFLGNASEEQYGCVTARLGALRAAPVPIQLGEPGIFDRAGVFYAGVELTPQLAALERQVVAATAPCGFAAEARPYHPHITLARAKAGARARELRGLLAGLPAKVRFSRFTAPEFLLYESHLSSEGSRYEIRQRFPLAEVL
jgi:RNA 2',3'-cyclic 3'-phosphodiesterase